MPDYDGDPAVSDVNGNGITDPQDLIMLFSNGVDDDGNGYVDDISGWDFFEFDNDPFDEVQYGHGTGEAEDSTAEANNGGDLGACPNCMVMPVRVGDSFVADINSFAQGVIFSVDTGAAVIQEALGTYNQSALRAAGDRLRLRARRAGDGVGRRRGLLAPHLPGPVRPHHHGERDRRLRRADRARARGSI